MLEAAIGKGTLFATDDLGDHWQQVSDNHAYNVRGFYFTTLEVAPDDADRVYFLGSSSLNPTMAARRRT